jgi:hypothetical protein
MFAEAVEEIIQVIAYKKLGPEDSIGRATLFQHFFYEFFVCGNSPVFIPGRQISVPEIFFRLSCHLTTAESLA